MRVGTALLIRWPWRTVGLALLFLVASRPAAAHPQELRPLTTEDIRVLEQDKRHEPKVTGPLREVLPSSPHRPGMARERVPIALERDGLVPVTIYTADPGEALALLRTLSRPPAHVIDRVIEVYLTPDELPRLSALSSVLRLTLIEPPHAESVAAFGSTVSQGRSVHNAANWIAGGYTGAGVKVGIIDTFKGIAAAIAGGEVPTPLGQRCYTGVGTFSENLNTCTAESSEHGTAVAETLVDLAPDVQLYLASPVSSGDLKESVDWMIAQGVRVINLSQTYPWDGYGDGTSPFSHSPLTTVNTAVAAGVTFVVPAGNHREGSYLFAYRDLNGNSLVEFAGSTGAESLTLSRTAGQTIQLQLRWDGSWSGTASDLELYLYGPGGGLLRTSLGFQNGEPGSVPWESIVYPVPVSGTYSVRVKRSGGPAPSWIQLTDWSGPLGVATPGYTDGGGIGNPAESASPGLLAVGAAAHFSTATIESFSSRGPTPDGRVKPDIVGADRTDTLTYGAGAFTGTSQAAPHVAALAALVLSAFPSYTPAQVVAYLKTRAEARDTVPNTTWGSGFARVPSLCAPTISRSSVAVDGMGGTVQVGVTADTGCPWSASTSAGWISASPTSGSGSAQVTLTVSANPSTTTGRTATATIAGQTVTVTQSAAERPLDVTVASIVGNTVTLHWQWPGAAPDSYVLKGGIAPGQTIATIPIASRVPALTFDAPTGVFYVRLAGVRGGTELPVSDDVRIVVNVPEKPSAPADLLGLANGNSLALSWTPTADGGAATGLVLDVTGALALSLPLAMTEQFTFDGVPPGTYTFRVRATNAQGSSAPSNPVTLSFPGTCQAPMVPQNLEAYRVGTIVTIRWNAPATGTAPTRYELRVGGAVSLVLPVPGRTLTSPAPPGTYSFTVAAQNACGTSPASAARSVTVP